VLLFVGIAIATPSAFSNVILYAFDQNPAGSDDDNERFTLHNGTIGKVSDFLIFHPSYPTFSSCLQIVNYHKVIAH